MGCEYLRILIVIELNMEWCPPIYILCHPTYEKDRHQFLTQHCLQRGIPSSKINICWSFWGSDIDDKQYFQMYDPYRSRFGEKTMLCFKAARLSRGELSLLITFFASISKFLEDKSKGDTMILFESDVYLRPDFMKRLQSILEEANAKEGGWDYISLGEGVGTRPPDVSPLASYFGPSHLYEPKTQWVFRCCDSMVLHRRFLEKIQKTLFPFRECLDWELNLQMMLHKGISYWVDPPLAEQGSSRARTITTLPA